MGINLQKASTLFNKPIVNGRPKSIPKLKDIARPPEEVIERLNKKCEALNGDTFERLRKAVQEKKPLKFELSPILDIKKPNIFKRTLAKIFG